MPRIHALGALLVAASLSYALPAAAQLSVSSGTDRWFFGGGVGLGFGDATYVNVSPFAGYRLTDEFSIGAGLQYRYRHDSRFGRDLSTTDYGTNVFARYQVFGPAFVHAEYEYLSYQYYSTALTKQRTGVSSLLAGGGISQAIGSNASMFAMVLYNLSYSGYSGPSPYSSPWVIRFGVGIGF